MHDQIEKYVRKLMRDGSAIPESIRLYALDDRLISSREDEWAEVFGRVFEGLNISSLLFARPALPFADFLIRRAPSAADRLTPEDSETRVFLHDIPFIRTDEWANRPLSTVAERIVSALSGRKAALLEGLGAVSVGSLTIEQAYIGFSTIFHTTFVKYLLDLLKEGFMLDEEQEAFADFSRTWSRPIDVSGLELDSSKEDGHAPARGVAYEELCRIGRYTVEKGLVDSFFGNISVFDGRTIYISETASSLDELEGHIVPVAIDGSSTAGVSASSELPAHRAVYQNTSFCAVLHGHPKFSVVMSMYCTEEGCEVKDCTKDCNRSRFVCGVPIVTGETGTGGIAMTVPRAIKDKGACIVYGHGVFAASESGLGHAFMKMVDIENCCRAQYFRLAKERMG